MDGMELPKVLQTLFTSEAVERLARQTGCIRRERLLNGGKLVQTLVFGLLHAPEATGSQLAQTAMNFGLKISSQALEQRLDQPATANFLKALLEEALRMSIATPAVTSELLQRFTGVELLDSTTVTLPDALEHIWSGCGAKSPQGGKAVLKVQARMDLVGGGLQMELSAGRAPDQKTVLQTQDLKAGSLHVRDLGYFDLDVLATIADSKAFFLTRLMNGTVLYDMQANQLDLLALLRNRTDDLDIMIQAGSQKHLPLRLIARRLPEKIAKIRRRRLRKKARSKGYKPTKQALGLRAWSIVVTNAPAEKLTVDDALALLRVRWQIELLFKLWKSHGRLGHSRRRKAQRLLAETYAKLLAMLLQHWILWQAMGQYADRSLVKGAAVVRSFAWELLRNLAKIHLLREQIAQLKRILESTARIQKRGKKPATFQIIENPAEDGYERYA